LGTKQLKGRKQFFLPINNEGISYKKGEGGKKKLRKEKKKQKNLFPHSLCHSLTKYLNLFFKHICQQPLAIPTTTIRSSSLSSQPFIQVSSPNSLHTQPSLCRSTIQESSHILSATHSQNTLTFFQTHLPTTTSNSYHNHQI